MPNTHFVFTVTPYDREQLLPQVSHALEQRTELVSRQKYPGLWRLTDSFRKNPGGSTRSPLRTRMMSIVWLVLGIFLLVPSLMAPRELMVPLLVGAVAIAAGAGGLWRGRKNRKNPFDKSAAILLSRLKSLPEGEEIQVAFSADGMTMGASDQSTRTIPWDQFTCAVETPDTILLVYEHQVLLLQKKDLTLGTQQNFRMLLSSCIPACRFL